MGTEKESSEETSKSSKTEAGLNKVEDQKPTGSTSEETSSTDTRAATE